MTEYRCGGEADKDFKVFSKKEDLQSKKSFVTWKYLSLEAQYDVMNKCEEIWNA